MKPAAGVIGRARRVAGRTTQRALGRAAGARRRLDPETGAVALTFDDGPDPGQTPRLLDALARADVRATFFFIGTRARAYPELARQARQAGHAIGSHSLRHLRPDRPVAELRRDYLDGRRAVEDAIGQPTELFRPPYGQLSIAAVAALRQARLRPWLWSSDPGDWMAGAVTASMLAHLEGVPPGAVVLMHDSNADAGPGVSDDQSATVALIGPLAERLRERGMSFVTLEGCP